MGRFCAKASSIGFGFNPQQATLEVLSAQRFLYGTNIWEKVARQTALMTCNAAPTLDRNSRMKKFGAFLSRRTRHSRSSGRTKFLSESPISLRARRSSDGFKAAANSVLPHWVAARYLATRDRRRCKRQ